MSVDRLRSARRKVVWQKINPDLPAGLHEPKKAGDVGWDLEAAYPHTIRPGHPVDVATNVRLALPSGYWAEIRARSSIVRSGLVIEAGIIDTGYRGPLFALVRNMQADGKPVHLNAGRRIAQVVFHKINEVWIEEAEVGVDTERGEGGFGSTG